MSGNLKSEYRLPEWRTFRAEMLEREGNKCSRCERRQGDDVVLQVHHKAYVSGRKPWEYTYSECEVLCRGCHGELHGKVRPSVGWECFGDDDLGDPTGNCDYCGTELRYVFFVSHPHWEPMEVGTNCCDNLTGREYAANKVDSLTRHRARVARFIQSPRWRIDGIVPTIKQKGIAIRIVAVDDSFRLRLNDIDGRQQHPTVDVAKRAAFEFIESGDADRFFRKLEGGSS